MRISSSRILVWYKALRLSSHVAKIELKRSLIWKISGTLSPTGDKFRGNTDPKLSTTNGTRAACDSKSDRSR